MLEYAIKKASEIPYVKGEYRHFAVASDKRGKILAESSNSYTKSSPKMKMAGEKVGLSDKIYWHAECKVIYSVRDISKIHKLTVVRVNSKGEPVNSKPCIICETLIQSVGVKVIEYSL